MHVVVRFYGDARTRVADVRSVLRTIDSELALGKIEVMTDSVKQATAPERFQMQAMSVLAGVCLLLAALGIAAVTAYDVGRRTREIAVRMSLGAESRQVMMLILRTSLWPIAARCLVGLIASIPFARSLASGLYGIRPWDWPSAVSALVALLAVACAAAYLPARRAAKVDPMVALRCE
jgi:ABC-type antimicrobial peptide transport system permease subunit